jgi:hypothetical protein
MLGSDLFGIDFLILKGFKSTKYSPKIQRNFVYYFSNHLGEYISTIDSKGVAIFDILN